MAIASTRSDRRRWRVGPGQAADDELIAALDEISTLLRATSDAETEGFDAWQAVEKKLAEAPQGTVRGIETARRRRRFGPAFWAGVSSVAAAAAVVVVLLQPWHKAEAADNTVEIGEVDAAAGMVSVVQVPAEGQGATTVLWLQED